MEAKSKINCRCQSERARLSLIVQAWRGERPMLDAMIRAEIRRAGFASDLASSHGLPNDQFDDPEDIHSGQPMGWSDYRRAGLAIEASEWACYLG